MCVNKSSVHQDQSRSNCCLQLRGATAKHMPYQWHWHPALTGSSSLSAHDNEQIIFRRSNSLVDRRRAGMFDLAAY
jgi:hypothetical protein